MGRPKAISQNIFPYTIAARCINRDWFTLPMEEVWEIFSRELRRTSDDCGFQIHSFVLMSNHFHLIASTPRSNISQCMHKLMQRTSVRMTKASDRINETYAGRHFKCILHEPNYYLNAYKYNYRNPVTAGVCGRVEDYPYSTLPVILGRAPAQFPLLEDTTFLHDPDGTLKWLNTSPPKDKLAAAKYAFKLQYFKSPRGPNRKKILGPQDLL